MGFCSEKEGLGKGIIAFSPEILTAPILFPPPPAICIQFCPNCAWSLEVLEYSIKDEKQNKGGWVLCAAVRKLSSVIG